MRGREKILLKRVIAIMMILEIMDSHNIDQSIFEEGYHM
jgi:hypothetical protein